VPRRPVPPLPTRRSSDLLGFLVAPALVGSPASARNRTTAACGVERWTVKTLQDRPHLLPLRDVTIAYLITRPQPATLPDRRLPLDRKSTRLNSSHQIISY